MAIGAIWYPPVDQQAYEAIRDKVLQAGVDKGMQFHAAGEAEGQWRVFEVWDSRDGMERYVREDLGPAADEVSGGQAEIPQPELVSTSTSRSRSFCRSGTRRPRPRHGRRA